MARTDDDSWDVTESVGATALGVAMARADESASQCPLFTDPYAQLFIDAATARGWTPPFDDATLAELGKDDPQLSERMAVMWRYGASRTKWFDEFFIAAGAAGVLQAVILAAGLDARAWRLPWVSDTVVYEIDQPRVLAFKSETLRAHDARPAARYVAVPVDLRQDWPKASRDAGFDPAEPTAWSAEGLLPYLPGDAQDLLFERIQDVCAPGSRIAVEAFSRYLKCECLYDASYFRQLLLAELRSPHRCWWCAGLTLRRLLPAPPSWWWGWSSGWLHVHLQP